MNDFEQFLHSKVAEGKITQEFASNIGRFYDTYTEAIEKNGYSKKEGNALVKQLAEEAIKQIEQPFLFESYHKRLLAPFNYFEFAINFIRPLIDLKKSRVEGLENVDHIVKQLEYGENVVLFANHQTEPDPQIISILLEKTHPLLAQEMISVAGHRVITDPLAVPFSKGTNLLCIYSKKYIDHPPELKAEKQLHNQRSLKKLIELFDKGGHCIYVAPSGGRDRTNAQGVVEVAKFDPQSIDLFLLLGQKAKKPTHFYPLALSTFYLLPPPNSVEKDIGEKRYANSIPVYLSFGKEIDFNHIPKDSSFSKEENRQLRAHYIWQLVDDDYHKLLRFS